MVSHGVSTLDSIDVSLDDIGEDDALITREVKIHCKDIRVLVCSSQPKHIQVDIIVHHVT